MPGVEQTQRAQPQGHALPIGPRADGLIKRETDLSDALTARDLDCRGNLGLRSPGSLHPRHYSDGLSARPICLQLTNGCLGVEPTRFWGTIRPFWDVESLPVEGRGR